MLNPKFAETHNLVAFLEKTKESDGFEGIIDFLNAISIRYALTVNPTICTTCIEQFWATAKVKTVNGECQIQALVDKKNVIITETSIRSDLKLEDAEGTYCLPTATIFAKLEIMGLQEKVLDLEKAKTAQANEIASLKKIVKQLEKIKKSKNSGLERLRKVGLASRVESSNDVSLGAQEDASKQGRKIVDFDVDAEVTLIDETQERNDKEMLFDVQDDLQGEKVVAEKKVCDADPVTTAGEVVTTANIEVTTASALTTTIDELTLAQTMIEIKAGKPKAVATASTTTTTTRPKARGVVVQEPTELEEEERLARQKEEEATIALIESWDNTQAMIEADRLLAERLQIREQEELTDEEKARLFVDLLEKRKKHLAALRAKKRNKPPTKAQKKSTMSTYLKHMGGYKHSQLKNKSFDEI
ncbi:hypothetical protein Tco_1217412 [Tanacetum coccineum]